MALYPAHAENAALKENSRSGFVVLSRACEERSRKPTRAQTRTKIAPCFVLVPALRSWLLNKSRKRCSRPHFVSRAPGPATQLRVAFNKPLHQRLVRIPAALIDNALKCARQHSTYVAIRTARVCAHAVSYTHLTLPTTERV